MDITETYGRKESRLDGGGRGGEGKDSAERSEVRIYLRETQVDDKTVAKLELMTLVAETLMDQMTFQELSDAVAMLADDVEPPPPSLQDAMDAAWIAIRPTAYAGGGD